MFLLKGHYNVWVIRCHWKPLDEVSDEKAMIKEWIAYDEYNNRTIGGKYQDVSKDGHFLNRINKALYPELAEEYERIHGRSKNSLAIVSKPVILYNSKTLEDEDPMLYTIWFWFYSFWYMFGIFAREEGELKADDDGHIRHILKQIFD